MTTQRPTDPENSYVITDTKFWQKIDIVAIL